MKQFYTFLLAIISFGLFGQGKITVTSGEGFLGDEIAMSISLSDLPAEGVYGVQIGLKFDPTRISIPSITGTAGISFSVSNGKITGLVDYGSPTVIADGEVATFSFTILDDANSDGSIVIDPSATNLYIKADFSSEEFLYEGGGIVINQTEITLSDLGVTAFCTGDQISPEFTTNRSSLSSPYTLQLSDENGDFSNPTVLGATTDGEDRTFEPYTFDGSLTPGDGYAMRIVDNTTNAVYEQVGTYSIGKTYATNIEAQFCSGTTYELPWGDVVSEAGTYTKTYESQFAACDSVVTVELELLEVSLDEISDPFCSNGEEVTLSDGNPEGGSFALAGTTLVDNKLDPTQYAAGTYKLKYSVVLGGGTCIGSDSIDIVIVDRSEVEVESPIEICPGTSLDLSTVVSPNTGEFSGNNVNRGTFNDESEILAVGSYPVTYTYTDGNACITSVNFNVDVIAPPLVTFPDIADEACSNGEPVVLSGATPMGGAYSGSFVSNGEFDPTAAGIGVHQLVYSYTDPTTGCTANDTAEINVIDIPHFTRNSQSPYCESTDNTVLNGLVEPLGGVYSGANVTENNGDYLFGISDNNLAPGLYDVNYSYTDMVTGCSNDSVIKIEVIAIPTVEITNLPTTICTNDEAIQLIGNPLGGEFRSAVTSIDGLLNLNTKNTGTYEIIYTFEEGECVGADTGSITIFNPVVADYSVSTWPVCADDTVFLNLNNENVSSIVWLNGTDEVGNEISFFAQDTGEYSVQFTDENGCSVMEQVVDITSFYALPEPEILVGEGNLCIGEPVTLTTGSFNTYAWFKGGDEIQGENADNITITEPGYYSVLVENDNCDAMSEEVLVDNKLNVSISADTTSFCDGLFATLTSESAGIYQWFVNGDKIEGETDSVFVYGETAEVYAEVANTDSTCLTVTNTIALTKFLVPAIEIEGEDSVSKCIEDFYKLSTESGLEDYQWMRNGNAITGANGQIFSAIEPGNYKVNAITLEGCNTSSNTVNIENLEIDTIFAEVSPRMFGCGDEELTITANTNEELVNYALIKNGAIEVEQPSKTFTINTGAIYRLGGEMSNGCLTASDEIRIRYYGKPGKPAITRSNDTLSTNYPADSIQWYMDGEVIEGANESFIADITNLGGRYFTVEVFNDKGCSEASTEYDVFLGVQNIEYRAVSLYPNPSNGVISISSQLKFESYEIINVQGKMVNAGELVNSRIEAYGLAPGIYVVKLKSNSSVLDELIQIK